MKLLKFYSECCGPCKTLEKNLQEANLVYESINVDDVDVETLEKYNIRTVPTLVMMDDSGEKTTEVKRNVGVMTPSEIFQFVNC